MFIIMITRPSFSTGRPVYICAIIPLLLILYCGWAGAQSLPDLICEKSKMITASQDTLTEITWLNTLHNPRMVYQYYQERGCAPAWTGREEDWGEALQMISVLESSLYEGLSPLSYNAPLLREIATQSRELQTFGQNHRLSEIADLDILLTDAALSYARDLRYGILNPDELPIFWQIAGDSTDIFGGLTAAIQNHTLTDFYQQLAPQTEEYKALAAAYRHFLRLDTIRTDIFVPVPDKKADNRPWILTLRQRLAQFYDVRTSARSWVCDTLPALIEDIHLLGQSLERDSCYILIDSNFDPEVLDTALMDHIKRFQYQTGIEPDGKPGPRTLEELNIPIKTRLRQIRANLERWRWTPRDLGADFLWVNLPAFYLKVYENGSLVNTKKVVVGTAKNRSPIMNDMVE